MLNVNMLSVVTLSVIVLNVVMLSVVAPIYVVYFLIYNIYVWIKVIDVFTMLLFF